MLPVSDFDCLESAGAHARAHPVPAHCHVTPLADNALILGDPWFRQFVIFHDLRHHEVTDKTNNVSVFFVCVSVCVCLCGGTA